MSHINSIEKGGLTGVRIGGNEGVSANAMLKYMNINMLYVVDIWEPYEENGVIIDTSSNIVDVYKMFLNKNNIRILRMESKVASNIFDDESLDFVYIDANHQYEFVVDDIRKWLPKVRRNGYLCGHDYSKEVKRAVDEELGLYSIEHGNETMYYPEDWLIVKDK